MTRHIADEPATVITIKVFPTTEPELTSIEVSVDKGPSLVSEEILRLLEQAAILVRMGLTSG